nr:SdiA-regulated family protein [Pedobacter sp. ASV19]
MKKFYKAVIWVLPLFALLVFYACKPVQVKYTSPKGYDLNNPEKFNMPESLLEISGIAFQKGDAKTIYSIQDEDGKLFKQTWGVKKQTNVHFASKGDYEDLAILKETVFVLKSNGSIYVFPLGEIYKKETDQVKQWKKILPKGEYESLYADEASNKLYAITKNSDEDHKSRQSTGYIFNYYPADGNLKLAGDFKIDSKQIEAFGTPIKSGLKASALAKNPRTNEWYILSSVQKMLVITTPDWKVKEVHKISPSKFNQPEGIAFDKDFNLYISNEGDEITPGNILKFKYRPSK